MPQSYNRHQPMDDIKRDIKRTAAERAKKLGLPYAGALSPAEAAMRAGWRETYNVLEGFEGDKDDAQHRNSVGGWRKAGLPWTQS